MPNITQFEAGEVGLRPTEVGIEATAAAARRAGTFYHEAAQSTIRTGEMYGSAIKAAGEVAVDFADQDQIHKGALASSSYLLNKTIEMNKLIANSDPSDPTILPKFMDTVNQDLEKLRGSMMTEKSRNWMEIHTEQIRNHLQNQAHAETMRMSGIIAHDGAIQTINNYANMAFENPAGLKDFMRLAAASVSASFSGVEGVAGVEGRTKLTQQALTQIVNAGVKGAIQKSSDPEATLKKYSADKDLAPYMKPEENVQWANYARNQKKIKLADDRQDQLYKTHQATQNLDLARNDAWNKNVIVDQSGKITVKPGFFQEVGRFPDKYHDAPNAVPLAEALIRFGQKTQEEKRAVSNPETLKGLDDRMFDPDNPTSRDDVLRAYKDLSDHDFKKYDDLVQRRNAEPITDNFKTAMQGAKQLIEGTSKLDKEQALGKFAEFSNKFLEDYRKMARTGTVPPNALDLGNPNSMISQAISPYKSDIAKFIGNNGGVGASTFVERFGPASAVAVPAVSLPAIKDREKGKSYMTGRGLMEWTGKGWLPVTTKVPEGGL